MSITNKLEYLQETKNQIKNAITEKGVTISDTDTFRSYADKIASISTGTGTSSDDWQPEPDWWDIETILENDTEDYSQKIICLLTDELDDGATKSQVRGADKYKLSDGQVIETTSSSSENIYNIFDITKDKACSKGYKTRYIIYYKNSDFDANIILPDNAIYAIFSGVKFSNTCFNSKIFLQGIKFINNTQYTATSITSMFGGCHNLKSITGLEISESVSTASAFTYCSVLEKIPNIDTRNTTNMYNMFSYCSALKKIPNIDTRNTTSMNNMFISCFNLKEIQNLDMVNVTNTINMFSSCNSLTNIQNINNIKVSISFSNCNRLNHSTLLRLLNALVDLTDQTTQTLTLGSTNLEKLTDEEKAIATEKNWTLA